MGISLQILACPKCKTSLIQRNDSVYCSSNNCYYSDNKFLTVNGKPVLVDFDQSVIQRESIVESNASSLIDRTTSFSGLRKSLRKALNGDNQTTRLNFEKCSKLLEKTDKPIILIVGGGTIGASMDKLLKDFENSIISFDVYNSDNVDFIADGHSIPLKEGSVDLVIIQAVLEHVFDPPKVVSECYRVLKGNGCIYSETPFLQHVHEGPYDFTRFTVLGHRILFKNFEKISTGFIEGLGQSLLWSIEYFARGLFRSRKIGKLFKIGFFWLRWIEKTIPNSYNIDGACGCYFLGRKAMTLQSLKPVDFLHEYQGAQK